MPCGVDLDTPTIEKIIFEYAPPAENATANYITQVSYRTGIPKDQPLALTTEVLSALVRSITEIENGKPESNTYISDADITEGISYLPQAILQRIGFFVKKNTGPLLPDLIISARKINNGSKSKISKVNNKSYRS